MPVPGRAVIGIVICSA